jgi:hypothetical protein
MACVSAKRPCDRARAPRSWRPCGPPARPPPAAPSAAWRRALGCDTPARLRASPHCVLCRWKQVEQALPPQRSKARQPRGRPREVQQQALTVRPPPHQGGGSLPPDAAAARAALPSGAAGLQWPAEAGGRRERRGSDLVGPVTMQVRPSAGPPTLSTLGTLRR